MLEHLKTIFVGACTIIIISGIIYLAVEYNILLTLMLVLAFLTLSYTTGFFIRSFFWEDR